MLHDILHAGMMGMNEEQIATLSERTAIDKELLHWLSDEKLTGCYNKSSAEGSKNAAFVFVPSAIISLGYSVDSFAGNSVGLGLATLAACFVSLWLAKKYFSGADLNASVAREIQADIATTFPAVKL